jgi:ATP-binding cassette, subfamily B, multidrug efflux pump
MPGRGFGGGRSRGVVSGPHDFKKTSQRLFGGFKGRIWIIVVLGVLLVASGILSVVTPLILKDALNNFTDFISYTFTSSDDTSGYISINWAALYAKFGLMLGVTALAAVLSWYAEWIGQKIASIYAYGLRKDIKSKLDRMPLSYFDSQSFGEILSKGTNDIDNIGRNVYSIISQLVMGLTMLIGTVIAMFVTSWQLALVVMATLPVMGLTVGLIAVRSQKQFKRYREKYGVLEGQIEEGYAGFKIIKLFNQEQSACQRFDLINEQMTEADRKSQWISGFIFPSMRFIYNVGFVGVSVVSGLISNGSIGDLVAFLMFLQLVQQPFQMIGQISSTVQSVLASAERVFNLLDSPEEKPDDLDCVATEDSIKGEIEFRHVYFSYDPSKPLIEDMNIHIHPGETIAIVGPTGAGKTTIVNLIMRFYEVQQGEIVLDGVNINHYSREALRGSIGMVLQDTWLFNGGIKDNIRYGNSEASYEEVAAAAAAARVDHFVATLPGGYDFQLNEDGTNISQGQRQLITIARAIVSKPKIMILDEATSSVDTRTEKAIQDAMDYIMVGRTSFVIAHRLSTIKNAKLILVMNKGKIVEMGTHGELLAKNGFYADLYNSQFLGKSLMSANQ